MQLKGEREESGFGGCRRGGEGVGVGGCVC
jgi:hypothetical protein